MMSPGFSVPFRIEMSLSGSRNLRIFFLQIGENRAFLKRLVSADLEEESHDEGSEPT